MGAEIRADEEGNEVQTVQEVQTGREIHTAQEAHTAQEVQASRNVQTAQKVQTSRDGKEESSGGEPFADLSLEEAMDKLEETVRQMEDAGLPLEETFRMYREGVRLAAACRGKIEKVEQELRLVNDEK